MKEVTKVQAEFLCILESFMRGKPYAIAGDLQEDCSAERLTELFKLAKQHQMTAAVFEQIRGETLWKQPEYVRLFQVWKRETQREVMTQMQRTAGFLHIYDKFCEAGVTPLIVKGLICRNLYDKPDYRVSGDEDILIRREDFAVCDRILTETGFQRTELKEEDKLPYEIPYINPQNGVYIEMHFALFPETAEAYGHLNEEFGQVFKNAVCLEVQGMCVWTLSPTEHLFYLICHSFKHFLHSGFGLRQVCDMVLMAEQYGKAGKAGIDWQDIQMRLERLNMTMYWEAIMQIGMRCFGLDRHGAGIPEEMWNHNVDGAPMLKDLLDSGIYGDSSTERKHSSNMTLAAAGAGKANTANSLRSSLFPGKEYMEEHYPWLKKSKWLLPVAYGVRIVNYLCKDGDKGAQNAVRIGMDRVDLLRQYGIVK